MDFNQDDFEAFTSHIMACKDCRAHNDGYCETGAKLHIAYQAEMVIKDILNEPTVSGRRAKLNSTSSCMRDHVEREVRARFRTQANAN